MVLEEENHNAEIDRNTEIDAGEIAKQGYPQDQSRVDEQEQCLIPHARALFALKPKKFRIEPFDAAAAQVVIVSFRTAVVLPL